MVEAFFRWLIWQWWLDLFGGDRVLAIAVAALILVAVIVALFFLVGIAVKHPVSLRRLQTGKDGVLVTSTQACQSA